MQKFIFALAMALSLFPANGSAHETKTTGSISVLLHMEPQDSPVVNERARLMFYFADTQDKFMLEHCDCAAEIKDGENVLTKEQLRQTSENYGSNVAIIEFVFPHKGIYAIVVRGNSEELEPSSFSLAYDVRIERESITQAPVNPVVQKKLPLEWLIYAGGAIIALGVLAASRMKSTNIKKIMRKMKILGVLVSVSAIILISNEALAHVVVRPNKVGVGTFQTFVVSVPSEKDVATTQVRLALPGEVTSVTPTVKPGWSVEVKTHQTSDGAHPYEIVWNGGSIPGHFRDEFTFSTRAPASPMILAWKAYQTYADGSVVSWDLGPNVEQPKKADGSNDFSRVGPYSQTEVVDDLNPVTTSETEPANRDTWSRPLSVAAILIALASAAVSLQQRKSVGAG